MVAKGPKAALIAPSNRVLRSVVLGKMKVSPVGQREFKKHWADKILSAFDPDQLETPAVSERDGWFYVIDGQHRIDALKRWLGTGWEEQNLQCWVYVGLTEAQEAELFLQLNNNKPVDAFNKFKVGLQANRKDEVVIAAQVQAVGLHIGINAEESISCVATLRKVYERSDAETLRRTLKIVRDAYGDPGLRGPVIEGIGLLCQRYNGSLNDAAFIKALGSAHGGVNGLMGKAAQIQQKTRCPQSHAVAAAGVDINNRGKGGKKLPSWWKN